MKFQLPYGKGRIQIELPDNYNISSIEPVFVPGLENPAESLLDALRKPISSPPLFSRVSKHDRVGIIFNDITRATPTSEVLHAILNEISHVPAEKITLFNALGSHRENSVEEMRRMLDDELVDTYRIVQNNCFDPSTQVNLGKTQRGNEVFINRELHECDLKILTGFIEPHFFAGFSGGGKAVMPGMAGLATIQGNHSAAMIGNPRSTWGITQGNPIWEDVNEAAHKTENLFLVNVTLNKNKQITGIYCGDLDAAHREGCAAVKQSAMRAVPEPFDIVITTNSGYPLDMNLYQSVKGMSAAGQIVKPGGAIILAAECSDGLPEHGLYAKLLRGYKSPGEVLDAILESPETRHDQWQVQIQAMIQMKADIYVYSGLSNQQVMEAQLKPCINIEKTVNELMTRFGTNARICVLAEGPQTIPYIQPGK